MRMCSFLPSATEIVYVLGLQDQLHGVTFECDYPPQVQGKPIVVRSVFDDDSQLSSGEIDAIIRQRLHRARDIRPVQEVPDAYVLFSP